MSIVALTMSVAAIFAGSGVSAVLIGGLTGLFGGDSFETSSNRSSGISLISKLTASTVLGGGGSFEGAWTGTGSKSLLDPFEDTLW